ncbi:hypothetical protein [Paenibacillus solani]|uniref:Uncharacterized protein n=1 Tax=Paenibacillus solani TaxID=1705565 RepID=A0A0M1P3N1_9BACL|nr:hypothetical protein [Paenibacillus solani]KOR89093.1 hypothetical protein AM231_07885 [Paenibacillus solani]
MSDRSWRVFFVVVALIVLTGVVYSLIQSSTSFKELMKDQVYDTEKISFMKIDKRDSSYGENSVEITDPATIDRIINSFSNAKLWKTENYGRGTEYMIWVNVEYTPFVIYFTEPDVIKISFNRSLHKKYSWSYRMVNGYDKSIIEDLFKEK